MMRRTLPLAGLFHCSTVSASPLSSIITGNGNLAATSYLARLTVLDMSFTTQCKLSSWCSISQSDSHDLIADARESFGHGFNHPQKQTHERVCRFYVANSGSIAVNARDNFFELLENPLSVNSGLLDGRALLALDRFASLNRDTLVRESLSGLLVELRVNRTNKLDQGLRAFLENGPYPMQRFRLAATTSLLERPIILDRSFMQNLQDYWHYGRTINRIVDSMDTFLHVPDLVAERANAGIQAIVRFEQVADELDIAVQQYLASLGVVSI